MVNPTQGADELEMAYRVILDVHSSAGKEIMENALQTAEDLLASPIKNRAGVKPKGWGLQEQKKNL